MTESHGTNARKVVAIIQARMGSTRFPGKALADLEGKAVLQWVVEATSAVGEIDQVVVATTTESEDSAIEDWCVGFNVDCFRGEPEDVLMRYFDCASEYGATHIVRITADCPLLDSSTVETVVSRGLADGADYFYSSADFPDGFDSEGFTFGALTIAHKNAKLASEREHVTSYFKNNSDDFRLQEVSLFANLGHLRVTLDYPEDYSLIVAVLNKLATKNLQPNATNIIDVLSEHESIRALNAHIRRNDGYIRSVAAD